MKKRLMALLLVLCMVCSIIPVHTVEGAAAAGMLTLGQEVDVTLTAGEEQFYTFEATEGNVRYYFYLLPDANSSEVGNVTIRPEGTNKGLHGTSYDYSGYTGTMVICEAPDTVRVFVENREGNTRTVKVGVAKVTTGATSMALNAHNLVIGQNAPLKTLFEPAFTFEENVTFSVDTPDIVEFGDYIGGKNLEAVGVGTVNITATCGSMTATQAVTVTWPTNAIDITNGPATVSLPTNEYSSCYFKFTAPADANTSNYVVYCPARDDLELKPIGFGADNFQDANNELVILSNLIPNETYYLQLISYGAGAGNVTVTMEKSVAPTSVKIVGEQNHFLGDDVTFGVEFGSPEEYAPVEWTVEDPSVFELKIYSNYAADFKALQLGKTKVTATVKGTNISEELEVEVVDPNAAPRPDDSNANVYIGANDGNYTLTNGNDKQTDCNHVRVEVPAGSTLAQEGYSIIDKVFWNPSRQSDGWYVYEVLFDVDENGNRYECGLEPLEENPISDAQMLNYVIPADKVINFEICWAGDDADYYFELYFETIGGEMMLTDEGNNSEQTDGRGERVRKDGSHTLADALHWDITVDPTHPNFGTFEGWLEYNQDSNGEYVLVSNTPVSTSSIFTDAPKGFNVRYAAKWSGVNLNDYYNLFLGGPGGGGTSLPVNIFPQKVSTIEWVYPNADGYAILEFTAPADGLYMIGHNPEMGNVIIEETNPVISHKYDHDIVVEYCPFCGPVYELQKGVTYSFQVWMDTPEQMFYIYTAPEATDISVSVKELTGYVGSYVEFQYEVTPAGAFSGVNDSTSSDPTVAVDGGGANADCSRVVKLLKAGTANITVTLANGKSITVKVNAVEPPALTLGTAATNTLNGQDFDVLQFTAPSNGIYYVYVDSASGMCMPIPSDENTFIGGFNTGTVSGIWLDLQKGERATVSAVNHSDATETYTIKADVAGKPTSISLPAWEGYPTQWVPQIRPQFLPLGSYDDITNWTISDPTILQLEGFGANEAEFSALKPGAVDVTVTTAGGLSATGKFTVKEPLKPNSPETITLDPGEWKELVFQAPDDGYYFTSVPGDEDLWMDVSANDNSVYTEEYRGFWTTLSKDEYLYIWFENYSDTAITTTVEVVDATKPITSMTLTGNSNFYAGFPGYIEISVEPFGSYDFKDMKIADESVAKVVTVDGYSVELECLKVGTTTLSVTTEGGVTATYNIVVKEPETITLNQNVDVTLGSGQYVVYTFTAPEGGSYAVTSTGLFAFEILKNNGFYWFELAQPLVNLSKGEKMILAVGTGEVASSGTITLRKAEVATSFSVPAVSGVVGYTGQVISVLTPDGSCLEEEVYWSVADPSIANIVDEFFNGVALEYLKTGSTTLTMKCGTKTYVTTITVTEPIIVPTDPSEPATVTPEAVDSALESALSTAKPGETVEVVIDANAAAQEAGTTVTSVELPVESLQNIADANAVLTIELSGATVTMDAKTLEAIAKQADGATITLSIEQVEAKTLNAKQQKVLEYVKVNTVLTAQILSDGKYIGDFEGGSVAITVPFTPPEGKDGSSFTVWYVSDDGELEKMKSSYKDGKLSFTTKHFSDYVILEGEPASNPATGDSFMLIPMILLFAISAMAIVVTGKKCKR